jgi:hypothetical protein
MTCDRVRDWYERFPRAEYQPTLDEMLTEGGPHYDPETVAFIDEVIAAVKGEAKAKAADAADIYTRKAAALQRDASTRPLFRIYPESMSAEDIAHSLRAEREVVYEIVLGLLTQDRWNLVQIAAAVGCQPSYISHVLKKFRSEEAENAEITSRWPWLMTKSAMQGHKAEQRHARRRRGLL